ncbi:hypothetical protein GJAV_G00091190 [Gymnothorax javanicus]|nr:hypothetical protein GJAV_G00091190 [Gymnothorax javanicus]
MALSSGGWTHTPPLAPSPPYTRAMHSQASCHTVLMSVRVSVCHSGIRPLCLPGAGDECLRLQLSMDPGRAGEFRLTLRDANGTRRSVPIVEFDLRSVRYEVKSPRCHELCLDTPPHDRISFNFRCEKEAQEWATVVMSSLREAHRVADGSPLPTEREPVEPQISPPLISTEELCMELTRAIESGDALAASQLAAKLACLRVAIKIQLSEKNYMDTEISLAVAVEDASSSCCITVKVFPHMTIASLKQQVFLEYGFHPRVQRWVIGQCLCAEPRSLASYGVRQDRDTAFLYLLSARQAHLTRQTCQQDQESALLAPLPPPSTGPTSQDWRGYNTLPSRLSHGSTGNSGSGSERLGVGEIRDLLNLDMLHLNEIRVSNNPKTQLGWSCPSCTFINKPTRPGCEICSTARPEGCRQDPPDPPRLHQEKGRKEDLGTGGLNGSLLHNPNPPHDHDY